MTEDLLYRRNTAEEKEAKGITMKKVKEKIERRKAKEERKQASKERKKERNARREEGIDVTKEDRD